MVRLTRDARGYAVPMTRAVRTTLAMVLAILACWCVPATGAAASGSVSTAVDCPPLDLDNATAILESADGVTDVFAGTVREVVPVTSVGGGEGEGNQTTTEAPSQKPDARVSSFEHAVVVEDSFRSSVRPGDRVQVVTEPTADDGYGRLDEDAVYLFFATVKPGVRGYHVAPCSGTQRLQGGLDSRLRNSLDETFAEPDDAAPSYSLSTPDDGARTTPALGRLAAPGAAVALIGVLGLLVLARVGSRRT